MITTTHRHRLRYRRVSLLAISACCALIGFIYALWTPPLYEYSSTVRINRSNYDHLTTDAGTEKAIIHSSSLISEVLDTIGHDVEITSDSLPYVEKINGPGTHYPYPNLKISHFDVEPNEYDKVFTLTATPSGSFRVDGPGKRSIDIGAEGNHVRLSQSFTLIPRYRNKRIRQIKEQLHVDIIDEHVISIRYQDRNPAFAYQFLRTLVNLYVNQSPKRQAADIGKAVSFLKRAISADKRKLVSQDIKWQALNSGGAYEQIVRTISRLQEAKKIFAEKYAKASHLMSDADAPFEQTAPEELSSEDPETLRAQIAGIEAELVSLEQRRQDYVLLEQNMAITQQAYARHQQELQSLLLDAARLVGFASVIEMPDTHPYFAHTHPYKVALLFAAIGFVFSAIIACWLPTKRSSKPRPAEPSNDSSGGPEISSSEGMPSGRVFI